MATDGDVHYVSSTRRFELTCSGKALMQARNRNDPCDTCTPEIKGIEHEFIPPKTTIFGLFARVFDPGQRLACYKVKEKFVGSEAVRQFLAFVAAEGWLLRDIG